jgi:hypothetical protein
MAELIHQHDGLVEDSAGVSYGALIYGAAREDGTWEGWIEFHPTEGTGSVLSTERETTQPNREALVYWATGLETIYLEGALGRARA